MATKEQLVQSVRDAKEAVVIAEAALLAFESSPENNVFDSIEVARARLEERLYSRASEDCEGSYNCGRPEYTQEFIVGGERYIATLVVEYGRHDKTYYFVDGYELTVSEAGHDR